MFPLLPCRSFKRDSNSNDNLDTFTDTVFFFFFFKYPVSLIECKISCVSRSVDRSRMRGDRLSPELLYHDVYKNKLNIWILFVLFIHDMLGIFEIRIGIAFCIQ